MGRQPSTSSTTTTLPSSSVSAREIFFVFTSAFRKWTDRRRIQPRTHMPSEHVKRRGFNLAGPRAALRPPIRTRSLVSCPPRHPLAWPCHSHAPSCEERRPLAAAAATDLLRRPRLSPERSPLACALASAIPNAIACHRRAQKGPLSLSPHLRAQLRGQRADAQTRAHSTSLLRPFSRRPIRGYCTQRSLSLPARPFLSPARRPFSQSGLCKREATVTERTFVGHGEHISLLLASPAGHDLTSKIGAETFFPPSSSVTFPLRLLSLLPTSLV